MPSFCQAATNSFSGNVTKNPPPSPNQQLITSDLIQARPTEFINLDSVNLEFRVIPDRLHCQG